MILVCTVSQGLLGDGVHSIEHHSLLGNLRRLESFGRSFIGLVVRLLANHGQKSLVKPELNRGWQLQGLDLSWHQNRFARQRRLSVHDQVLGFVGLAIDQADWGSWLLLTARVHILPRQRDTHVLDVRTLIHVHQVINVAYHGPISSRLALTHGKGIVRLGRKLGRRIIIHVALRTRHVDGDDPFRYNEGLQLFSSRFFGLTGVDILDTYLYFLLMDVAVCVLIRNIYLLTRWVTSALHRDGDANTLRIVSEKFTPEYLDQALNRSLGEIAIRYDEVWLVKLREGCLIPKLWHLGQQIWVIVLLFPPLGKCHHVVLVHLTTLFAFLHVFGVYWHVHGSGAD